MKLGSPASVASSIGSVTSKLIGLEINEEPVITHAPQSDPAPDTVQMDAARWQWVKGRLYKQLGYSSPLKLQAAIDARRMQEVPEREVKGAVNIPKRNSL